MPRKHFTSAKSRDIFHAIRTTLLNTYTTATMAPTPEKEHLMEEVSKHNKVEDCWLVIGNDATGELSV